MNNQIIRDAIADSSKYFDSDLLKSIEVLERLQLTDDSDTELSGDVYMKLGSLCGKSGQYDKGVEYLRKSLELYKKINNVGSIINVYNQLGNLAFRIKNYVKAHDYYKLCMPLVMKQDDNEGKSIIFSNIGMIYFQLNKFEKALEYYQQAIDVSKAQKDINTYTVRLYNYASTLHKLDRIEECKKILEEVNTLVTKHNILSVKAPMLILYAEIETEKDKKISYFLETKELAQKIGLSSYEDVIDRHIMNFYADEKDYERAYQYSLGLNDLRDSLELQEVNKSLADIHADTLFEESNKQISELESFTKMVGHDLKEPMRMINSYSQILADTLSDSTDEKTKFLISTINDSGNRMEKMIDDLLLFTQVKNENFKFDKINLNDTLKEVLKGLEVLINESGVGFDIDDDLPSVKGNNTMLYQLFQNLIKNGIKYNINDNKRITIKSMTENNKYKISVIDNGVGIEKENLEKVFKSFSRVANVSNSRGTGLGLSICKTIVSRLNGTIEVSSEIDKGTQFTIILPVK
ncbi:MAG: ATP-binding protein [Chitinophagales bacterium]